MNISRRNAMGWFGALLLPWAPKKVPSDGITRAVAAVTTGDVNCYATSTTWVDAEMSKGEVFCYGRWVTWVDARYDETTGAAIEPLFGDQRDLAWVRAALSQRDA